MIPQLVLVACMSPVAEGPVDLTPAEYGRIKVFLKTYRIGHPVDKSRYDAYAGGWMVNESGLEVTKVTCELKLFDRGLVVHRVPFSFEKFMDDEFEYSDTFLPHYNNYHYQTVFLPNKYAQKYYRYWIVVTGAKAYKKPSDWRKPGHWFTRVITDKVETLKQLINKEPALATYADPKTNLSAIHFAASRDDLELVKFLVSKGANIKAAGKTYHTQPIHVGCGNPALIEYLIRKGANPNQPNNKGYQPSHYAARHGCKDGMTALIKHGANVNARTTDGGNFTPLLAAAYWHMPGDCLLPLIKAGAKLNVFDTNGWSPLHYEVQHNMIDAALVLIKGGADVNLRSKGGLKVTPLFTAATAGAFDCVMALLEHGADRRIKSSDGKTAAQKAREGGWTTIADSIDQFRKG